MGPIGPNSPNPNIVKENKLELPNSPLGKKS